MADKRPEQSATHAEIEKRAYEIYLERGGEHGRHLEHWLLAEEELVRSRPGSSAGRTKQDRVPGETELEELRDGQSEQEAKSVPQTAKPVKPSDPRPDSVEEASRESFPASDAPAWIAEKSPEKPKQSKKSASR